MSKDNPVPGERETEYTKLVSVRLTPETEEAVIAAASGDHIGKSSWIRRQIERITETGKK